MIIGFTTKTSKKISKIFCKRFKHCAILLDNNDSYTFIQIATDGIRTIIISDKEIKLLKDSGWVFINVKTKQNKYNFPTMLTCVGFAKRAFGITNPFLWTPDALYKYLLKNRCI